jgi:hypothetical protein
MWKCFIDKWFYCYDAKVNMGFGYFNTELGVDFRYFMMLVVRQIEKIPQTLWGQSVGRANGAGDATTTG